MDSGPAKDGGYAAFSTMNKDAHSRGDLVVDAAIAFQVYQAFGVDVIDKPADLVGMCFDNDLEGRIRVDDTDGGSIGVGKMGVDIRGEIFQPKFLSAAFKTYGGGVINVSFEKIPGLCR